MRAGALTRLPPDRSPGGGTLSRTAGEGLSARRLKPLCRSEEREGPTPQAWEGEGAYA
jgi:hypothetical protein